MNMLSIEDLYSELELEPFHNEADKRKSLGERPLKLGAAVMVLDKNNKLLLLKHQPKDNDTFPQDALGVSMETTRRLKDRIGFGEAPIDSWVRSLGEELRMTDEEIEEAGIYFARDSFALRNDWRFNSDGSEGVYFAYSFMVRAKNPQLFLNRPRTSEITGTDFLSIDAILKSDSKLPMRDGLKGWVEDMTKSLQQTPNLQEVRPIGPRPSLDLGVDVRFDRG